MLGHEQVRAASDAGDGSISMSASDVSPVAGETFSLSFVVTNAGPGTAVDVNVSIGVEPAYFSFVSASDGCTFIPTSELVRCAEGDLAVGSQLTGSVSLQVIKTGTQVSLAADLITGNDPNNFNNTAGLLLWPPPPPPTTTTAYVPPLGLTGTTLPPATIGEPYSTQLTATGGIPPYTFAMNGPVQPPAGLTLSPSGLLSGTPGGIPETTQSGIEIWDQQSSPAKGLELVVFLTLTIQPAPPVPLPPDTTTSTSTGSTPVPIVVRPHLSRSRTRVISQLAHGLSQTTDGRFGVNKPLTVTLFATRYRSTRRLALLKASRLGTSTSRKASTSLKATIRERGSVPFHLEFRKGTLIHGLTYVVHLSGRDARGNVATLAISFRT